MSQAGFFASLERVLAERPDRVVLEWHGQRVTATGLLAAAQAAADVIAGAGIRRGDRVLVQTEKCLDSVHVYLACLRLGAIFVPINVDYKAAEIAHFMSDCEPALVLCDPVRHADFAQAGAQRLLTLASDGSGTFRAALDAARVGPPGPTASIGPPPDPATLPTGNDPAVIIYTSGTTGAPKGAVISNANLLANALALREIWSITPADRLLHALPLFHIHGLFVGLNTLLLAGATLRMLDRFEIDAVIAALPDATLFMGVPTYYTRLLASARFTAQTARAVRLFICGSAPLQRETLEAFAARTGKEILERYGMSECGIITSNRPGDIHPGCVGRALPQTQVRIVDEPGAVLPAGQPGAVEVRGPGVFGGYWRLTGSTRRDFTSDGFFRTGDVGRMDAGGVLELVGRAKDLIICGGLNVYPKEIELAINSLPGIGESAVIGLPHPDFGEAVAAVVCMQPGHEPPPEASVIGELKQRLAGFKVPKRVFFESQLPRNAMGKVEKAALRRRYAGTFMPLDLASGRNEEAPAASATGASQ